jgi:oxaloacetate decarboxylase gamma subunit
MIVLMNLMSAFIHKFFPEPKANLDNATGLEQTSTNKKVIAAITAAIAHHRKG